MFKNTRGLTEVYILVILAIVVLVVGSVYVVRSYTHSPVTESEKKAAREAKAVKTAEERLEKEIEDKADAEALAKAEAELKAKKSEKATKKPAAEARQPQAELDAVTTAQVVAAQRPVSPAAPVATPVAVPTAVPAAVPAKSSWMVFTAGVVFCVLVVNRKAIKDHCLLSYTKVMAGRSVNPHPFNTAALEAQAKKS